jgi:hypothetical protein
MVIFLWLNRANTRGSSVAVPTAQWLQPFQTLTTRLPNRAEKRASEYTELRHLAESNSLTLPKKARCNEKSTYNLMLSHKLLGIFSKETKQKQKERKKKDAMCTRFNYALNTNTEIG